MLTKNIAYYAGSSARIIAASLCVSRDITEWDRRQKFRPNQNVLRDVTSRRGGRCVLPRIAVIAN